MNKDFDIDDILNDDDIFQPITDGLGFHHSVQEKQKISSDLKKKSLDLKRDLHSRQIELAKQAREEEFDMGELNPFYKKEKNDSFIENLEIKLDKDITNDFISASKAKRVCAFVLDLTVISLLLVMSLVVSFTITNISTKEISYILNDPINKGFLSLMVFFFYLLYFSFLDKSDYGTLGKRIFSLKLKSTAEKLSIGRVVLRSSLSLVSLLTMGIFSLLKLEDKLTETMIVEDE